MAVLRLAVMGVILLVLIAAWSLVIAVVIFISTYGEMPALW
jgi:hypothetical protein